MQNVDGKIFRVTVVCVLIVATVLLVRAYDRHHRHPIKLDDIGFVGKAYAHNHGDMANDRVVEFYKSWMRPQGMWKAMKHRGNSCCWANGANQDCFPVLKQRRNDKGELEVMPDVSEAHTEAQIKYGEKWYTVNTEVEEHKQPDPRTSPDGRSHVCIASGTLVVCYVEAWGG